MLHASSQADHDVSVRWDGRRLICMHHHKSVRQYKSFAASLEDCLQRTEPLYLGLWLRPPKQSCSGHAISLRHRSTVLRRLGRATPKPRWMTLTSLGKMMNQLMLPSSECCILSFTLPSSSQADCLLAGTQVSHVSFLCLLYKQHMVFPQTLDQ